MAGVAIGCPAGSGERQNCLGLDRDAEQQLASADP
jgi:hypothetical protein